MIISVLLVLVGVAMETWYGDKADDISDDIRRTLTIMTTGRKLFDTTALQALSSFKAIPALVTPDAPFDTETFQLASNLSAALRNLGWSLIPAGQADPGLKYDKVLSAGEGVRITTRTLSPNSPLSEAYAPEHLGEVHSPKAPDEKAETSAAIPKYNVRPGKIIEGSPLDD
jgi:hypothetical protein